MIHLSVAPPLGLDSIFFSFLQRMGEQNGHSCVDPPVEKLDRDTPANWIEPMSSSGKHHFVLGYRYPPSYWRQLVNYATTVVVLADGDGIARHVQHIYSQREADPEKKELSQSIKAIRHALDAMVEMTEWLLSESLPTTLLPPAVTFHLDSGEAFHRLERFYQQAGVPITVSCWQKFSAEAQPLLDGISPPSPDVRSLLLRQLSLDESTPLRLDALQVMFGNVG